MAKLQSMARCAWYVEMGARKDEVNGGVAAKESGSEVRSLRCRGQPRGALPLASNEVHEI